MKTAELFKQYLEHLFAGKRSEARQLIMAAQDRGISASTLLTKVIWPAMEQVDKLYHGNRISMVTEHMATRINRLVADQLQGFLARRPKTGQRMIVVCGDGEREELGAQITADLFEAEGWSVWFVGAGLPDDELLQLVGKLRPDVLCIYGAQPVGVPPLRSLIGLIREVGVCEEMQILVSGGVFNRAEGLAEEIKADLFAGSAAEAIEVLRECPVRIPKPDVPQPGRRRKRKKVSATRAAKLRKAKAAMTA